MREDHMRRPHRRSRKIGLTQGGRVMNGRAEEKPSRFFTRTIWEKLSYENDLHWAVLRENPSRDYFHPCNAQSIRKVLTVLPEHLTEDVRAVVLRRTPKVDQELGIEARRRYFCVVLNSFPRDMRSRWTTKPQPATLRHYEPWCGDWREEDGEWVLIWTPEEIRRYYLFHLLLHEIGHINEPWKHSRQKREEFAEDFALTWARNLGELA